MSEDAKQWKSDVELTSEEHEIILARRRELAKPQAVAERKIAEIQKRINDLTAERERVYKNATNECQRCSGKRGYYSDYRDCDGDGVWLKCDTCEGAGRVWKK
jgi:chromosome segregation ATPase